MMKHPVCIGNPYAGFHHATRGEWSSSVRLYIAHRTLFDALSDIPSDTHSNADLLPSAKLFEHVCASGGLHIMNWMRGLPHSSSRRSRPRTAVSPVFMQRLGGGLAPRCAKIMRGDAGSMRAYMSLYVRLATPNTQEAAQPRLAGSSEALSLADVHAGRVPPRRVRVHPLNGECTRALLPARARQWHVERVAFFWRRCLGQ